MKLSKREIILVLILLLIGIAFVEVRFLITPGIEKLANKQMDLLEIQSEYQAAQYQIDSIDRLTEKRDDALELIAEQSKPFLGSVKADALLLFTHEMLLSHGFVVYSYTPSMLETILLQPEQVAISELTYKLKEIAMQYRNINPDASDDASNVSSMTIQPTGDEYVELYSVQVRAKATYAQVKTLLDDFKNLEKTIVFNRLSMTPTQGTTGILDVEFTVEYFGIAKLVDEEDSLNDWIRDPIMSIDTDPFLAPLPETPETGVTEAAGN